MTVTVKHIWTCELCGLVVTQVLDDGAYGDPVITPPDGWDVFCEIPDTIPLPDPLFDTCDVCPDCKVNPDWTRYKVVTDERQ